MTWTPLKGPWTPPPELTGMTIPEICEELLRLRAEVAAIRAPSRNVAYQECKCAAVLPVGQYCPQCGGLQP